VRLHCLTGYICLNEFTFERKNLLAPGGVPRGPLMQLDRAHANGRLQEWPRTAATPVGQGFGAWGGQFRGGISPPLSATTHSEPAARIAAWSRYASVSAYHALIRLALIRASGENRLGFADVARLTSGLPRSTNATGKVGYGRRSTTSDYRPHGTCRGCPAYCAAAPAIACPRNTAALCR
jgi:hypothetical protein